MLVAYGSDSEGSADDVSPAQKPVTLVKGPQNGTQKIRVTLKEAPANANEDDGPARKRVKLRGNDLGGFNSLLPPPKREQAELGTATNTNGTKPATRKVFSLRTGAEPAFSRDSDRELRDLFLQQDQGNKGGGTIRAVIPKPSFVHDPVPKQVGKVLQFKPLSVSRSTKKNVSKKTVDELLARDRPAVQSTSQRSDALTVEADDNLQKPARISLFAEKTAEIPLDDGILESNSPTSREQQEEEIVDVLDATSLPPDQPETLNDIADSLNLSKAERRQLLGRHGGGISANKIVNFNTDMEWSTNQNAIASGANQQVQHNPVRGIAPGKHSLKQLVASAHGQQEALEENFARQKGTKKEVGSKYGW